MATFNNIAKNSRTRTVNKRGTVRDQEEVIYTCPTNCRAHMPLLYIHNGGGSSTDVEIHWYRADSTTAYIIEGKNMNSAEFLQWSGAFIVFEPGDELRFTPAGNSNPVVDVLVTVEEFFIPVGG
jgi:hypothetical protein